jgi:hypothetical protein
MSFAAWIFLFGIAAVAGPILAHFLAKPRYRRVPFTMLQFLKSSQIESHSRRNLRDLLLLFLRCAIIILIAFLFARPIIFKKDSPKNMGNIYYLGLDDSASMAYADGGHTYFKQLKDMAVDYIVSAESDAVFNICTLASGNWNYGLSKKEALTEVQSMEVKSKKADMALFISGLNSSAGNIKPGDRVSAYLISDFTGSVLQQFFNCSEPAVIDNFKYNIVSSSKQINNASIISASASSSENDKLTISVTVNNNGQTIQKRKLYAIMENENLASMDLELNPGQSKIFPLVISLDYIKGLHSSIPIELILTSDDNLNDDDKYYLAVQLPSQINRNVLLAETEKDEMYLMEIAVRTISEKSSINKYNVKRISMETLSTSDLKWANVFMCPNISDKLSNLDKAISEFIEKGGRAIFFLNDKPQIETAHKLFQQEIIPALPVKFMKEQAYLEINSGDEQIPGMDNDALKALSNYRIDNISLSGYWNCRPLPESSYLLKYINAADFIYYKQKGIGTSILVNTSIDDSLGSLFKSNASVALCQCLLGEQNKIQNSGFACDERIIIPFDNNQSDIAGQKQIWIQNPNGQKQLVSQSDSFITIPESDNTGWIKTTSEPIIYAGVNLPTGETNMMIPDSKEIENAFSRVFIKSNSSLLANGTIVDSKEKKPESLVSILAWTIIALLLIEPAVANRMRR